MLNILTALTKFLLDHEEYTEESCDIPDENIKEPLNNLGEIL